MSSLSSRSKLIILMLLSALIFGWSGLGIKYIKTINAEKSSSPYDAETITATSPLKIIQTSSNNEQVKSLTSIHKPIPTEIPILTHTPSVTSTPFPTETSNSTETPAFVLNPAGNVTAPILLYHHISDDDSENRYFVSLHNFKTQMESLRSWGYSSISATDLADLIIFGGERPNRLVVITFDDGFADVYQNAYPILQELGFVGTIYIYVDHVGSRGYINADQIADLAENGWEIGNHSMSHADLTINHSRIDFEVRQSRQILELIPGVKVSTFAYPYGEVDDFIINYLRNSGYLAGMGLGLNYEHTLEMLFLLTRIEVHGDYSLSKFASLLPWIDN